MSTITLSERRAYIYICIALVCMLISFYSGIRLGITIGKNQNGKGTDALAYNLLYVK